MKGLTSFLANTAIVYIKTLNFHWNMKGEQFFMYHRLLQELYEELAEGLDEIAERIQMLGAVAPGSMEEFLKLATLKEVRGAPSQSKMVAALTKDLAALVAEGEQLIALSEEAGDPATADLVVQRIRAHDKYAWLLRNHL